MYLKRLEMQGFKSFAARTTFDFGQGLTAIVGPNGSGKSNIADALRWVLGEGSSKLIRAKKLDDVIYAGSEKRPRADKVEVSMVLDNSTKWLQVEADEVIITRRGSRNGDSDYFLNNRRAKLREIQAILATAAVSQNSYAIIGQGLVESVLNLRPEDRRQLIEEAADIQRYRYKIEEAEQRVKQTAENVERVKLLVKEISPRMNQLEKQARRAGEYAQLSVQLQHALREFYETRWAHAQEALTVARATHDQAQAEFLQAKVALESVQRELGEVTDQLEQDRREASKAVGEKDKLDAKLREIERRMAVATERHGMLESRQIELKDELSHVQGERERAQTLLATGDGERKRLEAEVAEARAFSKERHNDLVTMEAEFRESHVHAADADARAKRLQAVAVEMRQRIKRLTDAREHLEKEIKRHDTRRHGTINQMAELVRLLRGLKTQDVQLLEEMSGAGTRRVTLEHEVEELRDTLAAVEATQNARRGKLEGLEARLKVLQEAQTQSEEEMSSEQTLDGAAGTIFELLRVPRGLEEAIAAALGDQLEAFIFEYQAEAVAAIDALARQRGPRATAIPMDAMKAVYPLNVMKEKGVLGVASLLVKYPQKYEKLFNNLLGRVIVVQDAEAAVRMLRRRLGTVVTVDGMIFDPSGFIAGGRPQAARAFVLAYERDLESIPKEITRIHNAISVTEREAESIRGKLRAAITSLSGITDESDGVIQRRLQLQDAIGARQQKLAQLRGEIRGVMGAIANIREQQRSYQQQADTLEQERTALLEEAKEATETSKHLGSADQLFRVKRKELQKAANDAADALARVDGELRSLTVQKENAAATLARIEAQHNARDVQLRGVEMELSTLEASLGNDGKEAAAVREELEKVRAVIPGADGSNHLEKRQADLNKQVVSAQNRMFAAERHTLETEADVRKWETDIDNMRQRMGEDGLVMNADGTVRPEKGSALDIEVPDWMITEAEGGPDVRPMGGGAIIDHDALGKEIDSLRSQIRQLGPVNIEAQVDYESLRERHDFLTGQLADLEAAEAALDRAISELTDLMRRKFETTFAEVAKNFERNFVTFFGGGHAKLRLSDPKHPQTSGVELEARPPGKRTQSLAQLSGGEKSLTSVALLFALLQANPAPFCVLDEVDAMLDEANVGRFAKAIKEQSQRTQFVVITHNRRTIEQGDSIYGISMGLDAASRVLSMRLGDVPLSMQSQN